MQRRRTRRTRKPPFDNTRSNWWPPLTDHKIFTMGRIIFDFRLTPGNGHVRVFWRWQSDRDPGSYALGRFPVKAFVIDITWIVSRYDGRTSQSLHPVISEEVTKAWLELAPASADIIRQLKQEHEENR